MSARWTLVRSILIVVTSMMGALSGATAAIGVTLNPNVQTIVVGGLSAVDIRIDGLGDGEPPSVGTYDLDITFNPSVLSFVSATFGDGVLGNQLDLFSLGNVSSVTPSTGSVNLFELSLDTAADLNALQATTFVLASLRFTGLSVGTSPIGLSVNVLGDADGAALAAIIFSGSVVVTAVPEPAIYVLILAGLALVGVITRKSRTDQLSP